MFYRQFIAYYLIWPFKESLGRSVSQGNVYLVFDEFKLLPSLQHIEDGVNFGRGLGVKVIAGIQSIHQLLEAYGESGGKNILAGFSTMFALRRMIQTRENTLQIILVKIWSLNPLEPLPTQSLRKEE